MLIQLEYGHYICKLIVSTLNILLLFQVLLEFYSIVDIMPFFLTAKKKENGGNKAKNKNTPKNQQSNKQKTKIQNKPR